MDFINSLIPVIDSSQFAGELGESAHMKLLLESIRKGKVKTDDEARILLYGNNGSELAYKKLKQRFREKLTEHVVLNGVAFRNLDNYAKVYRRCMTHVLAAKTLIWANARVAAMYICENTIKRTVANEYTDLTLLLSQELYSHYTRINYNNGKSRKYEKIMLRTQELHDREMESNRYYCELSAVFNTSRGSQKGRALSKAIRFCDKLTPYLEGNNISYRLLYNIYSVMTMRYDMAHDYTVLLKTCNEATVAISARKVYRRAGIYQFDLYKVVCYLQFEEYSKIESLANSYFREMTRSSLNWFILKIYVLASRLHSQNYQGAYEIIEELKSDKGYAKLPSSHLQILMVYEAHIEFLIAINKVKTHRSSKFRLYRFLNEIPIYTKDKRGLNIAILIVHVLILLQQRKFAQIIDRVDALNQYCHRHLRRDDTFRSNCFIKMLVQIPKADFNRIRTIRYAQPFIDKLSSMPLLISDQSLEVEIIPYERLWQMTLDLLD